MLGDSNGPKTTLVLCQMEVAKLHPWERDAVNRVAESIRRIVQAHGPAGLIALCLVGAEVSAGEMLVAPAIIKEEQPGDPT